jgi:hypothetical protein
VFGSRTPPETSTLAAPAMMATAARMRAGVMLSSRMMSAPAPRLPDLGQGLGFDLDFAACPARGAAEFTRG